MGGMARLYGIDGKREREEGMSRSTSSVLVFIWYRVLYHTRVLVHPRSQSSR